MWTRNTFEKFVFRGSLYSLVFTLTPIKSQAQEHNRHEDDNDENEEEEDEYERGDDYERSEWEV